MSPIPKKKPDETTKRGSLKAARLVVKDSGGKVRLKIRAEVRGRKEQSFSFEQQHPFAIAGVDVPLPEPEPKKTRLRKPPEKVTSYAEFFKRRKVYPCSDVMRSCASQIQDSIRDEEEKGGIEGAVGRFIVDYTERCRRTQEYRKEQRRRDRGW
jgi:hypothetical protein